MAKRTAHHAPTAARLFAYEVCRTVRLRDGFARELFATKLVEHPLPASEAAFARVLVFGVVATRGTLDELIDSVLRAPADVDADVRDALRISTYELFFLDKAPHAAVDEGVSLVGHIRSRATGVANFCLRRLAERKAREAPAAPAAPPQNTADLARAYGFPAWMAERLVALYGADGAQAFMAASNEPAPVWFTPNAILTTDAHVEDTLRAAGVGFAAEAEAPACYRLSSAADVATEAFAALLREGKVIISDKSSQIIAAAALPETPPASMLEIGAGRGTKTLLLESAARRRYGHQVPLYALDYLDFKLDLLTERLLTYGITEVEPVVGDGRNLDAAFPNKSFDAVFIDAPCSGLGTLRRHPELRWNTTQEDIAALAAIGEAMLASAATHVAPGGVLTFATCTITPEETTQVLERFLASPASDGFEQLPFVFAPRLASGTADAHFAVQFRRRAR